MTSDRTDFESRARAAKVAALVEYVDLVAVELLGLDPDVEPGDIADALRGFDPGQRSKLAVCAGQRPPSDETWRQLVATYERRASEFDTFARCGGEAIS